ncbi:hypothetical protein J2T09_005280 [Neorhizobium huautlense]|uniref:Uncharacterized protein n=1 Tax=Neorhizobium huautlense TaxID=67774 RepID=A0ABT9Q193_9HYPH|nr:hypothetical protein [Neorhizobium huautlense]
MGFMPGITISLIAAAIASISLSFFSLASHTLRLSRNYTTRTRDFYDRGQKTGLCRSGRGSSYPVGPRLCGRVTIRCQVAPNAQLVRVVIDLDQSVSTASIIVLRPTLLGCGHNDLLVIPVRWLFILWLVIF